MTSKMNSEAQSAPVALTIAGLDPSGGAGILADVRTFVAFGCFPTSVLTSITFQNTLGVSGTNHQTAEVVRAQTLPLIADFTIAGAKTGMLPTREVIEEVARLFREEKLPAPVVDPVMQATSGDSLIDDEAVASLTRELFPLARVVTPNIPEAQRLTGSVIKSEKEMADAARLIRRIGARAVLVKGGHLQKESALDLLDDDGEVTLFRAEFIEGGDVHGSGCTLSAAIAACLANGMQLKDAVRAAKNYVTELIRRSPRIGHGARPLFTSQ
jgi:hydroxymethylpyrimidine/phosphomethylpyrimidine kinase